MSVDLITHPSMDTADPDWAHDQEAGAGPWRAVRGTAAETLALAGRRLRHLRRSPGRLVGLVMNPVVMLIAVGYLFKNAIVVPGGTHYQDYLMAGVAAQVGLAGIGPTAISVSLDLRSGLADRLRSLPISRAAVLIGHSLSDTLVGLGALALVLLVGLGLGWRPDCGVLGLLGGIGILAVFIFAMVWVGILLGLCVSSAESIDSVGALVLVAFSFLSNAILAAQTMPAWIRPVIEWNPVSAVATECRHLWGNPVFAETGYPATHAGLVIVISLGALLAVVTTLSLRRFRGGSV